MKKKFYIPNCPTGHTAPLFGPGHPWLAPLAGYSDLPFRMLCREYGASVCVTEMISAKGLLYENPATSDLLASHDEDGPLVAQLFGAEPRVMAEALKRLKLAGYRYFDCNFGCPVRKVRRQKAGAALLGDGKMALEVARAMISAARDDSTGPVCQVGFKLRTGVDPAHPALPDLALRLEDAGASWLAVHPRWASQGYSGYADWNVLAGLAPRISIPLLASGDMLNAAAGMDCIASTGVTGVMYARGAMRNPAVFREHAALAKGEPVNMFTPKILREIMRRHIELTREYGAGERAFHKIRSLLPRYIRLFPGASDARRELCACQNWEELSMLVEALADRWQPANLEVGA